MPPRLRWAASESDEATAKCPDGGARRAVSDLRAECLQPLRIRQADSNRVYACNNLFGDRTTARWRSRHKVADDLRLGGTEEFKTPDGQTAVYSSRARALVDAVYDWSRFNSLPQGFDWIRRELAAQRVGATDLIEASLKYGDTGTIRRMGALLEREGVASPLLRKLERALKPTTGLIPWIPNKPKRGTLDRR